MTTNFSELRSPQVKDAADRNAALLLPVGQIEEHGPHLPIHTDLFIARRLCEETVKNLSGDPTAYVLEAVPYGYSQHVIKRWPGTFVLSQQTVIDTLKSVCVSLADMGFRKIVLVNAHGNHDGVAKVAVRDVADQSGIGVAIVTSYALCSDVMEEHGRAGPGGSCHAGEFETSVMLHLAPELVDLSAANDSDKLVQVSPYSSSQAFVSPCTRQRSESGTYGDPTVATKDLGRRLFEKMVDETAKFTRYYYGLNQV